MGLLFARARRNIYPYSCTIYLCPFLLCCGILYIQSREQDKKPLAKSFKKKIKKVLDKRSRLCYNKDVPRGTKQIVTCGIQQEKEVFYE